MVASVNVPVTRTASSLFATSYSKWKSGMRLAFRHSGPDKEYQACDAQHDHPRVDAGYTGDDEGQGQNDGGAESSGEVLRLHARIFVVHSGVASPPASS